MEALLMTEETKNEKFKRLAEKRANDIINRLRLVGNLSNRQQYDYSDEEVSALFGAIKDALRRSESSFNNSVVKNNDKFSFKD